MKETFGIIGAGNIGQTIARHLVRAGYNVIVSNRSGNKSLQNLLNELGARATAGTPEQAAAAEIVILALPWSEVGKLQSITDWTGRIVIDATNHFISYAPDFQLADLKGRASSEIVSDLLPGARIVKAFNTLYFKTLAENPVTGAGKRVLFISGDDQSAKSEVAAVIASLGFAAVDLGTLRDGSKLQEAKAPLAGLNLLQLGGV